LEAPFAKDLLIEVDGKKFGWLVGDSDYPQAEPALWTVAALAAALGRRDLVDDDHRRRLISRLEYAQTVSDLYRPVSDGGWNILPQQDDPAQHSTYTTGLALMVLLELRRAGLGWHDDRARLETLIRAATARLAEHFDARPATPGWRLDLNDADTSGTGEIADGVTLQIYGRAAACRGGGRHRGGAGNPARHSAPHRSPGRTADRLPDGPRNHRSPLHELRRHPRHTVRTHDLSVAPVGHRMRRALARAARADRGGTGSTDTRTSRPGALSSRPRIIEPCRCCDAGQSSDFRGVQHLYALASLLAPHAMRE
jgi:hypothetical protein